MGHKSSVRAKEANSEKEVGSPSNLTRVAAAYLACVAFAVGYLLTTLMGGDGLTAAWRGAIVAVCALVLGRGVIGPALSSVLDAMARDQAEADLAKQEEDE